MIGGSGALYLMKDRKWMRSLLRVVRANDRGNVSPRTVADHLATLSNEVHLAMTDNSVGPRCIVAWRFPKSGGGHQFYTGQQRDASWLSLPSISNGMDVSAIIGVTMPLWEKLSAAMLAGEPAQEFDKDELNAALSRLPDKPDEDLR